MTRLTSDTGRLGKSWKFPAIVRLGKIHTKTLKLDEPGFDSSQRLQQPRYRVYSASYAARMYSCDVPIFCSYRQRSWSIGWARGALPVHFWKTR